MLTEGAGISDFTFCDLRLLPAPSSSRRSIAPAALDLLGTAHRVEGIRRMYGDMLSGYSSGEVRLYRFRAPKK
jgi:hypothetical protein